MNTPRLLILGVAAIAAGGAALLARGLLGGGTPKVAAAILQQPATSEVLVAASDLQPGDHLTAAQVRWQKWPHAGIDASLITDDKVPNSNAVVQGTVVRSPIVAGEPITDAKIVRTDSGGMMAASVTPGMRAISINVTADSSAGGFILPNDRVDVILTGHGGDGVNHTATILANIRVLAIDQTPTETAGQKAFVAKTVTLEVAPPQAEILAWAQASGTLTLSLRGLADSTASSLAATAVGTSAANGNARTSGASVAVIRYGLGHNSGPAVGE